MVREHSKTIGKNKARGSDSGLRVGGSGRVVTEIVLGVRARVGCREGKMEGATDMVTRGRDHETDKEAW